MIAKVREGYQLPIPVGCPQVMYDIMKSCWNRDPAKRPSFSALYQQIKQVLINMKSEDLSEHRVLVQSSSFILGKKNSNTDSFYGDDENKVPDSFYGE